MSGRQESMSRLVESSMRGRVKCVVWDLDNTVWDGTLLEDPEVKLRLGVVATIRELDRRGILHSIASRNDPRRAMKRLDDFGLSEYFLYPQINWSMKSKSIGLIASHLRIGVDALAFVDDQAFERAEVHSAYPSVLCVDAEDVPALCERTEFVPRFKTEESVRRREMYRNAIRRDQAEEDWEGARTEFLQSLKMRFVVRAARQQDLQRAHELTVRTHQLNTTGYVYSYEDLLALCNDDGYLVLVAELEDRFGTYGTIGLAVVETRQTQWTIKLLLMSCRVINRGVGSVLITQIRQRAHACGVRLFAEFIPTDVNRGMFVTYRFNGFREAGSSGGRILLENDLSTVAGYPRHLTVESE